MQGKDVLLWKEEKRKKLKIINYYDDYLPYNFFTNIFVIIISLSDNP